MLIIIWLLLLKFENFLFFSVSITFYWKIVINVFHYFIKDYKKKELIDTIKIISSYCPSFVLFIQLTTYLYISYTFFILFLSI